MKNKLHCNSMSPNILKAMFAVVNYLQDCATPRKSITIGFIMAVFTYKTVRLWERV